MKEVEKRENKKYIVSGQIIEEYFNSLLLMQEPGTEYYIGICDDEGKVIETVVQKVS